MRDVAGDRHKPLCAVAGERTGLALALKWSMHDGSQVAELREPHDAVVEAPRLGVRLAEVDAVAASTLPSWSAGQLGKAALLIPAERSKTPATATLISFAFIVSILYSLV